MRIATDQGRQFAQTLLHAESPEEVPDAIESWAKTFFETKPDLLLRVIEHVFPGQRTPQDNHNS